MTGADAAGVNDQVLDAEDACGLVLAQGATPAEDAACVLFAGTEGKPPLRGNLHIVVRGGAAT